MTPGNFKKLTPRPWRIWIWMVCACVVLALLAVSGLFLSSKQMSSQGEPGYPTLQEPNNQKPLERAEYEMHEQDMFGGLKELADAGRKKITEVLSQWSSNPTQEPPPQESPQAATTFLERYPSIDAPEQVHRDQEFAVTVTLFAKPAGRDTEIDEGQVGPSKGVIIGLPDDGQHEWDLDVIVSAPDFVFRDGLYNGHLRLPRVGDSTPAAFFLRAKPEAAQDRPLRLQVTLWYRGAYLAKFSREVSLLAEGSQRRKDSGKGTTGPHSSLESERRPSAVGPMSGLEQKVRLDVGFHAPDLTLFILRGVSDAHPEQSHLIVESPFLQTNTHSFVMSRDLAAWLDERYRALAMAGARGVVLEGETGIPGGDVKERTKAYVTGFGRELYQKFAPLPFKEAFCRLVAVRGDDFKSIQVFTNDPTMPWEMMRPVCENGKYEEEFLGVRFQFARWHVTTATSQLDRPPQSLAWQRLVVIAPQYASTRLLPHQRQELAQMQNLPGFQAWDGNFDSVKRLLGSFPEGVIHFAGHGVAHRGAGGFSEYRIQLEDKVELDLNTWRGLANTSPQSHPLVFFNACDVGQAQQIANFVDGWAPAVLESGASGYIGGLWPLNDASAASFAMGFYAELQRHLVDNQAVVAEAIRITRSQFYDNGDPTFLAYVFYGDPYLALAAAGSGPRKASAAKPQ